MQKYQWEPAVCVSWLTCITLLTSCRFGNHRELSHKATQGAFFKVTVKSALHVPSCAALRAAEANTLLSAEAAHGHCRYRKALLHAAWSCDLQAWHKAMLCARAGGWMLIVLALPCVAAGWVGRHGMQCAGGGCCCMWSLSLTSFQGDQVFFYPSYQWIKINGSRTEALFSWYIFFFPSHFHAGKQIPSNVLA